MSTSTRVSTSMPEKVADLNPDVVILDYRLPVMNGIEATQAIRAARPETEVLIFTMHESEQLVSDVLSAGAKGYLLKSDASRYIVAAVEALAQGKPYFNLNVSAALLDAFLRGHKQEREALADPLTAREREIVQLLAEGKSNKQIANMLSISLKTVESHRASIMRKLDAHSVVDIVRYAMRNKLTPE